MPNKDRALGIALLELSIAPLGYLGGSAIAHIIVARSTYKWIYWAGVIQGGIGFMLIALFCKLAALLDGIALIVMKIGQSIILYLMVGLNGKSSRMLTGWALFSSRLGLSSSSSALSGAAVSHGSDTFRYVLIVMAGLYAWTDPRMFSREWTMSSDSGVQIPTHRLW